MVRLPLLAAESMENARKEYAEAEALYAEKLAPEEFAAAGESLKLAEARMAEQAYWDSHLASLESARQSSAAKTRALAGLPGLRSEIDRIRTESEELKKSRGTEFAPEELAALDEKLAKSDEAIGRNSIKEAAGALAGSDGLLAAARRDLRTSTRVATVDSAHLVAGQLVAILTLAGTLAGQVGHYGAVDATDGAAPGE